MKNKNFSWKIISAILVIALIVVSSLYYMELRNKAINGKEISKTESKSENENVLSLWTDTSKLKTELTTYMNMITDNSSKDFIPVENRIAVFDMDGTLCCETDPGYFDHKLLYHRVMEDPNYKDIASQ